MITERDYYNIIDTAKDDGRAEGIREGEARGKARGRAEGRTEAERNIARKMLETGMDRETIMKITGIQVDAL